MDSGFMSGMLDKDTFHPRHAPAGYGVQAKHSLGSVVEA